MPKSETPDLLAHVFNRRSLAEQVRALQRSQEQLARRGN